MYFISAGEVEIELDSGPMRLGDGQFFGEVAVLRHARRSATIRALQRTHLLVLDAHDFRALLKRQPQLAERLNATVRDRLGRELVSAEGDLVTEELAESDAGARDDARESKTARKHPDRRNRRSRH
jgi:voltage-gated potassium channel